MKKLQRKLFPYLLLLPSMILLLFVMGYPLGYSFLLSFREWNLRSFRSGAPFIGLGNYTQLLSEPDFWRSMRATGYFVAGTLTVEFVLGMAIALLLNQSIRGRGLFRSLILLPMMATNVVVGLGWRMMMAFDNGILNWFLSLVGIPPVTWLSRIPNAMPSLILVDAWNTSSFVALILLAGLQAIPEEIMEAARIDGASSWQAFRRVTLPLLRPSIMVALVWRFIDTFRIFDVVFTLTAGGPAGATEVVSLYAYREGFQSFELGYASAVSYVMIVFLLVITFILFRLIGRTEEIF